MESEEIRLDYLQNPKLDKELIDILCKDYNFNSIVSTEETTNIEYFRDKLKKKFNKPCVVPFSFSVGGFLELFLQFKKIYFLPSLHYEIRKALEKLPQSIEIIKIPLDSTSGALGDVCIDSINDNSNDTLIIAPLINEDIFSINDFESISNIIKDATFALDISYSLALGLDIKYNADIYLINSSSLALLNGIGLIISNKTYSLDIYRNGISQAIYTAIEKRNSLLQDSNKQNIILYERLKNELGDDIALFASNYPRNTIPIRFKHINTRNLIQHLYLDNIIVQSSQDCYLGIIKPSYTLLSMGFGEVKSRELCAITFKEIKNIDFVIDRIINSYKMIRLMEF